jgi:hypothetical protein
MVLNATFNNILILSWQFYWWRKPEPKEESEDVILRRANTIKLPKEKGQKYTNGQQSITQEAKYRPAQAR